jgi:hypothetical protein
MIVITGLDPVIRPLRKKLVTKIELTVHDFAISLNTVIASSAKQSMVPRSKCGLLRRKDSSQ